MEKQKGMIRRSGAAIAALTAAACITWPTIRQHHLNHALLTAVRYNDARAVRASLAAGADPDASFIPRSDYDRYATRKRRLVDWLYGVRAAPAPSIKALSAAIDFNGDLPNGTYGFPPENVAIVRALLDAGASPNTRCRSGTMPIIIAATMAGDSGTVGLLLDRGANVDGQDDAGYTSLMIAASRGETGLTRTLLQRGADTRLRNKQGRTAQMLAVGSGPGGTPDWPDIARLLQDHVPSERNSAVTSRAGGGSVSGRRAARR